MRHAFLPAVLCVALTVAACSDASDPTGLPDAAAAGPASGPLFMANGARKIPITFVVQFQEFVSGETRTHGNSGRSRSHLCLRFSVQEGDLEGLLDTCFYANDPSDQTASQGPDGWFTTTSPDFSEYEVCMPSMGWCGTFSETSHTGKVYPQPRGVEFNNSEAMGGGDFAGMKMKGTIFECPDSQGDRGCFDGYLIVPPNR